MNYTISGYSTALFSTWFFVEELGLLFDAGDGVTASLLQKSGKVRHLFITHADRDHINGVPQLYQLNARKDFPKIYYPADSGSFPALQSFLNKFDPHLNGAEWIPIRTGMSFHLKGNLYVEAIRNEHIPVAEGVSKSLSYKIVQKTRKLKDEFKGLSGPEIATIAKDKGQNFLTEEKREELLGYSGDTPVQENHPWNMTKTLIHEATFLSKEVGLNTKANKHSSLPEVMEMIASTQVERLILSHFSSRYSPAQIDQAIRENCKRFGITIPVYRILPGKIYRNILEGQAANE